MKRIWILIGAILSASVHAQTVYTWEDEQGVLHFSDTPDNNKAKALNLPDVQAVAPAPKFDNTTPVDSQTTQTSEPEVPNHDQKPQPDVPPPLKLTLVSPQHDQTLRSNRGLIAIEIELNRKLGIGEQLQLMLDGRRYGAPQTTTTWALKNIDRGTHTIAIQAHRSGKLIASTTPVTVFLHRATIK
ncbi:DUF4124 domain-containing protein [Vibrio sp. D404a]|uniref:DUF4124 domain-containing protein n=1 Tax=unclassified Vibrio TaxID=2614977 RepID=UPI00255705DC|nr:MULTISPECIES: DUF4124 domain-containing protein [unclassified Vibrio]MDK9737820.1 DUF4124 domain-containing protein [Vibrio sp. D404a]MDK9795422.1 DUF4124 domain-containing protein [Vibrio sp. D449a]